MPATNGTIRGPSAWGGDGSGSGSGGAPTDAPFITTAADPALTNETLIGAIILPPDVLANRPAAASTVAGSLFHATDTDETFRSTGAAWADFTDGGGSGNVELYDSDTPPVAPTFPYIRVERDMAGDVQEIYFGSAT